MSLDRRDDAVLMLAVKGEHPALGDAGRLDQRWMILGGARARAERPGRQGRAPQEVAPCRGDGVVERAAHLEARINVFTSSMT